MGHAKAMTLVTAAQLPARGGHANVALTNPEELREFYDAHYPGLVRHIDALIGDHQAAQDLAHETFLRALARIDGFSGRSSLKSWVHGIAVNLARTYRATHTRRERILQEGAGADTSDTNVDGQLDGRRALARLQELLCALPDPEREAFVLHRVEELPLTESAQILGISKSTITERAQRAEAKLRKLMQIERSS